MIIIKKPREVLTELCNTTYSIKRNNKYSTKRKYFG